MANIVLTNISKLNSAAKFSNYSTDDMGFIRGRYTNEAAELSLLIFVKTIFAKATPPYSYCLQFSNIITFFGSICQ